MATQQNFNEAQIKSLLLNFFSTNYFSGTVYMVSDGECFLEIYSAFDYAKQSNLERNCKTYIVNQMLYSFLTN